MREKECLKELQKGANWAIWCKANPKDKGEQAFREHSRCIFMGKCKEPEGDSEKQEGASRGRHVTRARSRWKRADMSACAAHSNMECWVHHDTIIDDDQANQMWKETWEQDDSKVELKIDLQGLERHFW